MLVQICLVVLFLYLVYLLKPTKPPNFPPGPPNFPLIGGVLSLLKTEGDLSGDKLTNLGKTYGPITGIYLRTIRTIVLNGYEVIKEVSNRDDFAFRPEFFILTFAHAGRSLGVFFSNGQLWKEQRRFTLRNLRDFGFGKRSMEGLIHEEAEDCISSIRKALKETSDNVISMHNKFGTSVINILLAVVTGKRYSYEDRFFQKILALNEEAFRSGDSGGTIINDYPWLRHVPIVNASFKVLEKSVNATKEFLKTELKEHRESRSQNFSRDFMDIYLKEMEEQQQNKVENSTFFEDQMLAVCADLFTAGAESTSNTVAFGILYMMLYPEIQEKLHKELDSVVGKDRLPSVDHKPNLHYMEAVMTELYRVTPIAPMDVPRANNEDVKLMGYDIPKNTLVMLSLTSIHMDKEYWGDPEVFRPDRFINDKGEFVKPERVLPFGFGKRACVGEPLARMSAFLLFGAVIQKFSVELVPGKPRPSTIPLDGFTLAPKPFEAKLIPRI